MKGRGRCPTSDDRCSGHTDLNAQRAGIDRYSRRRRPAARRARGRRRGGRVRVRGPRYIYAVYRCRTPGSRRVDLAGSRRPYVVMHQAYCIFSLGRDPYSVRRYSRVGRTRRPRACTRSAARAGLCAWRSVGAMERVSVVASHLLCTGCTASVSSVEIAVDVDAIVDAPGDEAPRLIALAQLAKEGAISAEELLEATLKVMGVTDAPTVDQSAVSGSEYVELDSDAGQSLLEACTSDRERECLPPTRRFVAAFPASPDALVRSC